MNILGRIAKEMFTIFGSMVFFALIFLRLYMISKKSKQAKKLHNMINDLPLPDDYHQVLSAGIFNDEDLAKKLTELLNDHAGLAPNLIRDLYQLRVDGLLTAQEFVTLKNDLLESER